MADLLEEIDVAEGTCSVAKCGKDVYCKSYCANHYRKFCKYGDPLAGTSHTRLTGTPEERFWPRVDKFGPIPEHRPELGPCWLWTTTASTANGYPQFRCGPRMVLAYRFAYENVIGPIPSGLDLDHLCRVKKCVNPNPLGTGHQPRERFPYPWTPEHEYPLPEEPRIHARQHSVGR